MKRSLNLKGTHALSFMLSIILILLFVMACNEASSGETIDPPSNVTITAQEGAILISWQDNSDNEAGFAVLRKTGVTPAQNGDGFEQEGTTNADATSYLDEDVDPNQSYHYRVGALDGDGKVVGDSVAPANDDPVSPDPVNEAPTAGTIDDITVTLPADDQVVDLTTVFADDQDGPEGLTYSLTNTDDAVVMPSLDATNLTLSFLSEGSSEISITGEDSGGLTADTSFTVTVEPPVVPPTTTGIESITVNEGAANQTLDLSQSFADETELSYSMVGNTEPGVVTPTITDMNLELDFANPGTSTLTVSATNTGGASVEASFDVTVQPNTPPTSTGIDNVNADLGDAPLIIDLSAIFTDVQDAALDFAITANSNPDVVDAVLVNGADPTVISPTDANSNLQLTFLELGDSELSVMATDSLGEMVSADFSVHVNGVPQATNLPDITLDACTSQEMLILNRIFSDPEGYDKLTIDVTRNTKPNLLETRRNGVLLYLEATGNGFTDLTLTATDPYNASASTSFRVTTVLNTPPVLGAVTDVTLQLASDGSVVSRSFTFSDLFRDANQPASSLRVDLVDNTEPGVVDVFITDNQVTFIALSEGQSSVQLIAQDCGNENTFLNVAVTILP